MFRRMAVALMALGLMAGVGATNASAFVLTFEGLQDQEFIQEFYNGGTGSAGSSGPNLGVSFGGTALSLIDADAGGTGNFANEPSADTIAFFLTGSDLVMNVAAGFTTGFSFFYTSSTAASVTVWSGLNATGVLLGTLNLIAQFNTCGAGGDPTGAFACWDPVGVAFGGTALSVSFAGTANQTGFDDITIGSSTPGVPEPGTLVLLGIGLTTLAVSRRRRNS